VPPTSSDDANRSQPAKLNPRKPGNSAKSTVTGSTRKTTGMIFLGLAVRALCAD
jgi:hypothetical protein